MLSVAVAQAGWAAANREQELPAPLTRHPGRQGQFVVRRVQPQRELEFRARPAWLAQAHQALVAAVAAVYGWADATPAMPDEEILWRLLALNLARARP